MNIALVTNTSWNIYNFRIGLIKSLQADGFNVFIISPDDGYVNRISKLVNVTFCSIDKLDRKGSNPFKDILLIQEYYKIYKKNKINIVLQFTIKPNVYGSVAANLLGIKSVANVTGLGSAFLKKSALAFITTKVLKYGLNKSSKVVTQNGFDKIFLAKAKIKSERDIVIINGSGINVENFKPFINTNPSSNFIFLFIGRFLKDKGIHELIEAFNELSAINPRTELHLLGNIDNGNPSSVDKRTLDRWLANNDKIKFLGHQRSSKEFINYADCIVLPSYREGLAKSLLEAMSMAKPIITTNVPGCSELVVDNKNGILCEAKSSVSLQKAMEVFITMPQSELINMGLQGRNLILEKYDEKIINEAYLDLIKNL